MGALIARSSLARPDSRRRSRALRRARVVIAVAAFVPMAAVFLDVGGLPGWLARALPRTQLVPAVLALPAAAAVVAVAAVGGLTLVFGRVYCSTLCPLGTLQDLALRAAALGRRRRRFRFARPSRAHLGLGLALVAAALTGHAALTSWLEPYSAFGRTVALLFRPLVAAAVNGLSRLLGAWHVYAVAPVPPPAAQPAAVAATLLWAAALVALAVTRGRLFCNLLCPAGALLRLLSRFALVRVRVDEDRCNGCGACERACKASCIDAERKVVAHDACVGCFDCLAACPTRAVRFGLARRGPARPGAGSAGEAPHDPARRRAIAGLGGAAVSLVAGRALSGEHPATASGERAVPPAAARAHRGPVTPPGSRGLSWFTGRCTACGLCVASCPPQVLRPSLGAYGAAGLLQPRLVYTEGSCTFDCVRCGEVCPTGAILPLAPPEKHRVQVGRARLVKEECVVVTKGKACGACSEHCPTKAARMVPYDRPGGGEPGLKIPEIDEALCVGCGACEHPCPVRPQRAIFVEALERHGVARPPPAAPAAPPAEEVLPGGEFPF